MFTAMQVLKSSQCCLAQECTIVGSDLAPRELQYKKAGALRTSVNRANMVDATSSESSCNINSWGSFGC
jgi:hypothetical protein